MLNPPSNTMYSGDSQRPSLGDNKRQSSRRLVDFDSEQLLSMEEIRDNVRLTASKLLNDLDSSDEEDDDSEHGNDQLPHAEEARLYAGRLLERNRSIKMEKQKSIRKPINIIKSIRAMKDMRDISDSAFSSDVDAMSMEMDIDMDDTPQKKRISRHKVFCILGSLALLAIATTIMIFFSKANSGGSSSSSTVSSSPPASPDDSAPMGTIIDFLVKKGISDSEALHTEGTPQRQAVDWIANTDTMQYDPKDDESRIIQRYAVTVLYYALNGPEWKHQVNFLAPVEVCSWCV